MRRAAALAWVLSGCDVERGLGSSGVALEDAVSAFQDAYCERQTECCSPFEVPNVAQCVSMIEQRLARMRMIAEHAELVYDPSCWAERIEALDERGCASEPDDGGACTPACRAWHGPRRIGEYCTVFEVDVTDCEQGLVCAPSFCEEGNCKEVCLDPCARSQLGEPCLDVPCDEGMSCDITQDACVPTPAIGEPCVWGVGCGERAMCDAELERCVADDDALGPAGAPCNAWSQCESGSCPAGFCAENPGRGEPCVERCADGLACDAASSVCVDPGPAICTDDPL